MICPYCLMDIEDDSAYCDQCGGELFVCPTCGKIGKEEICKTDNVKFVSVKNSLSQKVSDSFTTVRVENAPEEEVKTAIRFSNKSLGIELVVEARDIIGRRSPKFSNQLGNLKQISGSHAKIELRGGEWFVSDLDSSNGTKYKGERLTPYKEVRLESNTNITFANVEFYVEA